tara:strand:+ start:1044 stop:1481 length:438 start_codon:yes stop_codon:yes gene_type:complete
MTAGQSPHGSGDQAAAWLATVFTLTGGLFACIFVVVTSGEPPGRPMMVAIGVITVLLLTLWLLRDKPPESQQEKLKLWHFWKKQEADPYEYKPRPRKKRHHTDYGTNQPPTLESIREATDEQRTWVPSIRNIQETSEGSQSDRAD